MGMLFDELKQIKKQINGQSWNTISTDVYREMKDALSSYTKNYKKDKLLELVKDLEDKLDILCCNYGNIFVGEDAKLISKSKEDAFNDMVKVLNNI